MGCEIGMSPCWYVPPSRAAGVASPPPWSTQIRISRGDGLAKDCSNRADTTPANSQLVSTPRGAGTGLPSPKKLHAKDGGKQPRPPPPQDLMRPSPLLHPGWVHPGAWGHLRDPRHGQGSILQNAKRGFLPRMVLAQPGLEHGALRFTWPRQGKFQNFPSQDHMSTAR